MPVDTIASAVRLMKSSLMLHWNLFQLFHPIGGRGAFPDASGSGKSSSVSGLGPLLPPPPQAGTRSKTPTKKQPSRSRQRCAVDCADEKPWPSLFTLSSIVERVADRLLRERRHDRVSGLVRVQAVLGQLAPEETLVIRHRGGVVEVDAAVRGRVVLQPLVERGDL